MTYKKFRTIIVCCSVIAFILPMAIYHREAFVRFKTELLQFFSPRVPEWLPSEYKWSMEDKSEYPTFMGVELGQSPKNHISKLDKLKNFKVSAYQYDEEKDELQCDGTYLNRTASVKICKKWLVITVEGSYWTDMDEFQQDFYHLLFPSEARGKTHDHYNIKNGGIYVKYYYSNFRHYVNIYCSQYRLAGTRNEDRPKSEHKQESESQQEYLYYHYKDGKIEYISESDYNREVVKYESGRLAYYLLLLLIPVIYSLNLFSKRLIKKEYIHKINQSKTAAESIEIRKKFKRKVRRNYFLCVVAVLSPLLGVCIVYDIGWIVLIIIAVVAILYYFMPGGIHVQTHISTLTLEKIERKTYSIFLRGFSTDSYFSYDDVDGANYSSNPLVQLVKLHDADDKQKVSQVFFSEYKFCEAMKSIKGMPPLLALGMTKELEAPLGAERIYFDDHTWKNGVSKMMHDAKYVFILINKRANCVYETNIALNSYLEKTVFIADEVDQILEMKNMDTDSEILSSLPIFDKSELPAFFYYRNGEWKHLHFLGFQLFSKVEQLVQDLRSTDA